MGRPRTAGRQPSAHLFVRDTEAPRVSAVRKTFIAGHRGLVGSALVRRFQHDPRRVLLTRPRRELDLTDARAVERYFDQERPDEVLLAAARVGGIQANSEFPV